MANAKWDVDVNVKSDSAKTAATHVDHLEAGLRKADASASKATGVFQRMSRVLTLNALGFHHISLAAGEAHAKTMEFLEFVGAEAALETLKEIGEKLLEIGEEAVKSAAKAERMNRVFAIQQGGRAQGKAAQEWVEKFSKTSEFSEAANESAFVGLRKQRVSSQHAGLIMKASADIAAGSEDKNAAYQEAISAFERIQQTGRVNARMLRPLGIGVEDFKKLPEFKGMTNAKVNAAMGKKDVDENQLFQLIMAHAGETKIGTRSADNVDLLQTKLEKLQELPERFFKKLGDTKAVGQLAHALDGVLTKLDPDSPTGAKIFGALEHAMTTVAGAFEEIDFGAVADTLKDDVIPAFEAMIGMVKPFLEFVEREMRGLHVLHDMLLGPTPKSDAVNGFHSNFKRGGEDPESPSFLKPLAEQPTHKFKENVEPGQASSSIGISGGSYEAYLAGAGVSTGLAAGVSAKADLATNAAGTVADAMVETVKKKHKTHSPSEVFEDIGAMDVAGYVGGVKGGRGEVAGAMSSTFDVPAGGRGGGSNSTIHIEINANISVGGGGEDPAELGRKIADAYSARTREHVLSVLEQALAGGGG